MNKRFEQKVTNFTKPIDIETLPQDHPLVRAIVRLWKNDANAKTHELFYEFSDVVLVINNNTYHFNQITLSLGRPNAKTIQTSRRMKFYSAQFEVKIHTHAIIDQVKNNPNIHLKPTFELICSPDTKKRSCVTVIKSANPNLETRTWLSILAITYEAIKRRKFNDSDSFKATKLSKFLKTQKQ